MALLRDLRPARGRPSLILKYINISHRHRDMESMVDTLVAASYVSFAEYVVNGTFGAETPGADPTPQKRGPPPLSIGRGGRLPTWLAAECRPTLRGYPLLLLLSIYRNMNAELWIQAESLELLALARVAPAAR